MTGDTSILIFSFGVMFSILVLILGLTYLNNDYTLRENVIIERMVANGADPILAMCAAHNRLASDQICFSRSLTVKGN